MVHKLSTWKHSIGWLALAVGATLAMPGPSSNATAADPSFVGALAIAVESDVAKRLELSEEVKANLVELINRREDQALEIVLANKDLPPFEQTARLVPFVAESERQGFALLTVPQREKLQQIYLARQGMSSLGEPVVVQSIGLSDEQQAIVKRLLDERAVDMTKGGENERRITRAIYERKLAAVLNDQQRGNWQTLAGLADANPRIAKADAEDPPAEAEAPAKLESTEDPSATAEETPPAEPEHAADTVEDQAEQAPEATEDAMPAKPTDSDAETEPSEEPSAAPEEAPPSESEGPAAADVSEEAAEEEADTAPEKPTVGEPAAPDTEPKEAVAKVEPTLEELPRKLRFNFEAAPWRDVLKWFADTAELSLDATVVPLGTFNYRDDRAYSVEEAIDLLNSYLLTKGYTLVRRDRILLVVDYESEIPDELVTLVTIEELDKCGKYEFVKCLFPLARMSAEDAADMVDPFLAPHGKVIPIPNARQILVIETGGKLRAIRDMINRVERPEAGGIETVVEVPLENISAEEFLTIARPLMDLAEGENSGDGINIAVAPDAKTMYVTGEPDKLLLIRELVPFLDKKLDGAEEGDEPEALELRTYFVKAANPQVVLRVLQTLLANMPGVRMEMDETSGKLVAWAYPEEHRRIDETIKMLEGQAKQFEVIQLQQLDPELAVAAVNKFFGLVGDDEQEGDVARADAPIVDGDPISMQIWVRGTDAQIEQIKDLVSKLEAPLLEEHSGGNVRMIPLTGPDATTALENAQLLWGRENKIRLVTPSALTPSRIRLRTVTPLDEESQALPGQSDGSGGPFPPYQGPETDAPRLEPSPPSGPPAKDAGQTNPTPNEPVLETTPNDKSAARSSGNVLFQFASQLPASEPAQPALAKEAPPQEESSAAEIRVAITPGGIFIASDDLEALDEFERRLRAVSGPSALLAQRDITVFYLKYAKADVAHQLLQEILGGHVDDDAGSLLGDMTTNLLGGGLLGGLIGGLAGGDGGDDVTTIQATGMVSIVPDPRLNALIVEANPTDLKLVEELLQVIDRESSVTEIETAGVPHPIVVKYASADEVAAVVREVFSDRIATTASRGRQQPSPEDFIRALRGQRSSRDQQSRGEEQKMTISVDQRTNSLIVVAPEPLYRQVQVLVELIDQPGLPDTDHVEVVPVNNAEVIAATLEEVIAQKAITSQGTSSSGQLRAGQQGGPSADQIRQRIEMFQRLRDAGGLGGMMSGGRPGGGMMGGGRPGGGMPGGGRPGGGRGGR